MSEQKLAFAGSGIIGGGLAVNAILGGFEVCIYDVISTDKIRETIAGIMNRMVNARAVTEEEAKKALQRAQYTNDLKEAVKNTIFVQECVPERMELKKSIYRNIQEVCGDEAVIASSTSSLMPSDLQEGAMYPEKILVGHPYNPSYLLPLIELCPGKHTSQKTIDQAMDIYNSMGKQPILCRKEVEGFIVNKFSWTAMDIAKQLVMDGVCTVEDMDKAIIYGPGMRMAVTGQILTMSLGIQGGASQGCGKVWKGAVTGRYHTGRGS